MDSEQPQLVLIGGGNMGSALLGGLVAGRLDPRQITVVETDSAKREALAARFGVATSATVVPGAGALVAVKPADVPGVCGQLAGLGVARIVSIAAGVSVARLQQASSPTTAVVRAMPNTPALVGEGMTAICPGPTCSPADVAWAQVLLSAVGEVVVIPEDQMDAFTAVAGSGPAYVFLMAEALLAAAREEGLPADVAEKMVRQLFRGAGVLLSSSEDAPSALREKVTSPNGTTAAGLAVFEGAGFRELVNKVVRAAADRSAEMQRELG
jgi:pyrroline-5-carboxylate reductase